MRKSKLRFWGFLAPSLIAFCIVVIIPTCIGFFYSLTNWNGIVGSDIKFVGFQNFIDIFTRDDSFVHAFLFTALFSVCAVVLVNFVGFALALLVTQKFRGATLLRGIFFMPNMNFYLHIMLCLKHLSYSQAVILLSLNQRYLQRYRMILMLIRQQRSLLWNLMTALRI